MNEKYGKLKDHKDFRRLYDIWNHMKQRCNNPNCRRYNLYGGRGIKVCKSWNENFLNFFTWALRNGYKEDLSIDRINVNGNYKPANCRWVDMKTQKRNKQNTYYLEYKGQRKCLGEWAEEYNIDYNLLWNRVKSGMLIEKALSKTLLGRGVPENTPVRPYNPRLKSQKRHTHA